MSGPEPHPKWMRQMYFWIGIIATVAYRIIIILNNYSSDLVKISWYVGTIGFVIYFMHRYDISQKRQELIEDLKLDTKLKTIKALNKDEKVALSYILKTLRSTREKWNYIFIFAASFIALVWGIYTDFF